MKKRVKIACLALVFLLVISGALMAGGGSQSSGSPSGKTKLQFWTWLSNEDAVAEFNRQETQYEVEHVQMAHADINNKLIVALSANAGAPDIATTTHRYFSLHGDTGKLYDMSSIVRDVFSQFPDSLQKLVTVNGKICALPVDISPAVLWYRRDIFTKYGIKTPVETWNQYNEIARTLKRDGVYVMPIFNPAGTWGSNAIAMFLGTRGGNIFTPEGKVIRNNKELEFVLNYFYTVNKEGYGESLTFFTPEFWGELKSGNVASWPMNMAEGANIKRNMPELSGQWGVMPIPRWDDKTEKLTGFWGGTVLMVPDQGSNQEASARFVKWFASTEEGQLAASRTWNAVPAFSPVYKNSFYTQGDPYFGGDCTYAMINPSTPFYYYDWAIVEKILGEQIDLMFADRITPAQAREAIENNIAAEAKR
ncbi:MAG: extracellular solute-binding protein [Treponema sp.]|jgi:ABC-type glycerol-3-phosphate transport system substrate-binding protein|nr:extracellular solute-binding protein [Treponema sp.]